MASEAEASCESDPNFAIICAFLEKFGELCGIGTIDFVELQNMLENNLEVPLELMNLHIKLLRKTKKNVTVERWERALVNMCHTYSSKDAWEIERFGYKKTRLQVKLRALKELLEMQFDFNTKFKNEVNKMSAGSLRAQPLGRDKLGRAYWFQTDNNYQIRIYKEDPDEETWHLIAKDREGLLSLINELADGDSKLSSDSALNEDSNSLSEKPFIDTGQSDNSNETKSKDNDNSDALKSEEKAKKDVVPNSEQKSDDSKNTEFSQETFHKDDAQANKTAVMTDKAEEFSDDDDDEEEEEEDEEEEEEELDEADMKEEEESLEVKRPILRIKSLSELMEKPKESRKANFLSDLPELTIVKKPKLDSSQIIITKGPRGPLIQKEIKVSPAVESPVLIIKGLGSGADNKSCNITVSQEIEEPVMYVSGSGFGKDCQSGNEKKSAREESNPIVDEEIEEPLMYVYGEGSGERCLAGNDSSEEIIVSEEIEEEVMYIFGEGSGCDSQTGNEKEQTTTPETDKSKNNEACTLQTSKLNTSEAPHKVPIDSVNIDTIIDSKTESELPDKSEENVSPVKMQFFFGPGSLNIKPNPLLNTSSSEDASEKPDSNNGSVPEENKEKKEANGECQDAGDNVETKESTGDTSGQEENKVPSSECSKFLDTEQETDNNKTEETNENDSVHEQIEEEDSSFKEQVKDVCEQDKPEEGEANQKEETINTKIVEEGEANQKEETNNAKIVEEPKNDKSDKTNSETIESSQTNELCSKKENSKEVECSEKTLKEIESSKENEGQKTESIEEDNNTEESDKEDEKITDSEKTEESPLKDEKDESTLDKKDIEECKSVSDSTTADENVESKEVESKELQKEGRSEATDDKTSDVQETQKNSSDTEDVTEKTVEAITEVDKGKKDDKEEREVSEGTAVEEKEEEKSKTPGPASKRKRGTRNTSTLNESITEEDIHPRKKMPVEKKKTGAQKSTEEKDNNEKVKEDKKESSSAVTDMRSIRQTRKTRSAAVPTPVVAPVVAPRPKGRPKKIIAKSTKSDEADSPAPLESVTIVDTDNSNTAGDNPEKDPLAVSEEEIDNVEQAAPSITSFSFDYNPSSPAVEESKRSLRKRGRENLEAEAPEKEIKRPKTKGKKLLGQTLRKSVEERRQQVGEGSSDENELPKKGTKAKGIKKAPVKKKTPTPSVSDSDNASQKSVAKVKKGTKTTRLLKNLGVKDEDMSSIADSTAPVRQSRRIAQIKIKEEATRRRGDEDDGSSKKKKKKSDDKDFKVGKRKRIEEEVKPAPTPPMVEKKRKKKNKQNKISIGWKSSSEDSDNSCQEEEEVSEYEEHHEEEPLQFKSDHEFSPESDLECDEPLPLKRARTVRKEESDDEPDEEFPCQKCGKSDHPEWILLCDKCDNGWHCSCLRPALFVIPEGDWFCPSCQHETLKENLNQKLIEFDKMMVKKEMEDRRKERLAYVGISLNNVLPAKEKKEKKSHKSSDSEESSRENTPSGSEESDSDEPIYQLRQRRQAHSYKFQDYDDLINSALQEEPPPEVEKTHTLGRGKDIATIVNAAKEEEERNGFEDLPPVVPRDPEESRKKAMSYRKKPKRLNNLEVNSDDEADDSDEDFKGSSSDETEEDYTEDSDDSFVGKKSSRPVRRSTRARTTRYDADFINDDDSDDKSSKKKKKKRYFSDSESSLSDDWRGKKKKSNKRSFHKKSKKKKVFDDSDLENYRKKKPKIKYGMDSEDDTRGRRTRGKKTSYLDTLGSDSEEETLKKKIKDKSDDEYVAEDDEEKESEEEAEVEKPSADEEEEEDEVNNKKRNSEESDSENEALVIKKIKLKNKRAIMDSDEEDEEEVEKAVESPEPVDKPEVNDKDSEKPEVVEEVEKKVPEEPKISPKVPVVQSNDTQKPAALPGLNVEKLKACGITVTKVAKDFTGVPPSVDNKETPSKLIEIGAKPIIPILNQRSGRILPPVNLTKIDKRLDELDEEEVEEMMENEEYANRQLELAAIQIREAKRLKQELEKKNASQSPLAMLKKTADVQKKPSSGRFFNMKPPQESMLGSSSLVMNNDDDNDELSEPPGVTLPMFSELGSMKVHNLSKSNNSNRSPMNHTPPPPSSPNRAVPVSMHNMPMGTPHPLSGNIPMMPPNSFGSHRPPGMMHQMRPNRHMGMRGSNMPPMMGPRGPMMDPRGPMGPMDPRMPMGQMDPRMSMGQMNSRGSMPPMESRGAMPPMESRGLMPPMESRGPMPPMESRGPMPPMESRGPMPPMESRGPMPPMESRGPMPPMESRGPMPPMESRGPMPPMESRGPMPPMESRGPMPPMESRGPMPPMDPNHPSINVSSMGVSLPGNIPNIPRNMNLPPMSSSSSISSSIPMGSSAPVPISSMAPSGTNLSMSAMSSSVSAGLNMTMGSNAHVGPSGAGTNTNAGSGPVHGANPASSINDSPDGTPKKRRGRGKGKKTLAAEAAAAAAAAGLPTSEASKTGNNKPPPVANIEIASPPQPFSQSQPAPSVITRMLQTSPGKGPFPVGRIRPKQFAMMQDSDDNESPRPAESQEKDMPPHPAPVPHGNHPQGHYGPPPGQYPPNYYPKEGQQQPPPPHGYHHQRPPPMQPYPPHHPQPPIEQAPMNQPPIGMPEAPPSMGQYSGPPPPSKSPYEGMPPHRPPYPNTNPGYNYDYNVPPPVMGDEGVSPSNYDNPSTYPDQYDPNSTNLDPNAKNVEEEPSGEFGGLVSYFSSQHEDEMEQ